MKEKILDLLKDGKAYTFTEIMDILELDREYDEEAMTLINEMLDDCTLYQTKKNRYMLFELSENAKKYVRGIFHSTSGEYGFVETGKEDIYIPKSGVNSACDGDVVLIKLIKMGHFDKKAEGNVSKVIKRNVHKEVGTISIVDNQIMVTLDNKKFKNTLVLPVDEKSNHLVDGDRVLVSFIGNGSDTGNKNIVLESHFGHINDPDDDIKSIMANYDISNEFSEEYLKELENIPSEVKVKDIIGRHDLRNRVIFTIDGDDTKDIDDALSIKKLPNGNYELGVHIADVSYYVKEGSAIDMEARKRGTSNYLIDKVIPMNHHQLSNGICSLNPNVDRLAITCMMEVDNRGKVVTYDIYPSVIRSRKQMTYKCVNKILEENTVPEGYESFVDDLKMLAELSKIIRKSKVERGSIDFYQNEAKILVDESNNVIDIALRDRGTGENLIEDMMIIANETVASHLYNMDLPSLYRVHGYPDSDKLESFLHVLSNLGISIKADIKRINPKVIQKIVLELKEYPEFRVLSTRLLTCMEKAIYDINNIGHFGIASKCYTHFTSPIRRYPDLMIHRLLRTYFFEKDGITEEKIRHFKEILGEIAFHSSERERASIDCERDVESAYMAKYMESKVGSEFTGMISGITNYGFYVQLDNMVEGLVPIESLNNYYQYDSKREMLVCKNNGSFFKLGESVLVKVARACKETKQIDFSFIKRVEVNEKGEEKIKKKY